MIDDASSPIEPAAPRAGRPPSRRLRRVLARQQILTAARALLREQPYDVVRLEDVARHAGLSRRTIYNQFTDKRELFAACRAGLLAEVVEALPPLDPRMGVEAGLQGFTEALIAVFGGAAHRELTASLFRDRRVGDRAAESYERQVLEPIRRRLEVFLYTKREAGQLDCALVGGAAQLFMQLLQAVAAPLSLGGPMLAPPAPARGAAAAIVRYFLEQLAPGAPDPAN